MRLGVALVVLVLCSLLTGCGDGSESNRAEGQEPRAEVAEATPFPPDSVLDEPEPTEPPRGRPTLAYAEREVRYLLDEVVYAMRTSYPDDALRDSRCDVCTFFLLISEEAAKQEWLFRIDGIEVVRTTPRPGLEGPWSRTTSSPVLDVVLRVPDFEAVDASGEVVREYDGGVLRTRFQTTGGDYKSWQLVGTSPLVGA